MTNGPVGSNLRRPCLSFRDRLGHRPSMTKAPRETSSTTTRTSTRVQDRAVSLCVCEVTQTHVPLVLLTSTAAVFQSADLKDPSFSSSLLLLLPGLVSRPLCSPTDTHTHCHTQTHTHTLSHTHIVTQTAFRARQDRCQRRLIKIKGTFKHRRTHTANRVSTPFRSYLLLIRLHRTQIRPSHAQPQLRGRPLRECLPVSDPTGPSVCAGITCLT